MMKKLTAFSLSLLLIGSDVSWSAPAQAKDVFGNKTKEPPAEEAAPPPANAPNPAPNTRLPLIEVSVDALEISESNADALGFLWGQTGQVQNGVKLLDPNHINFIETGIPPVFDANKFNRINLMTQFHALLTNNQIRVLANPTLLTKSGYEATFLVGGEIPYPTPGQLGQIGVEYKKYGVGLKILPQITNHETIDAVINVGVSNPDSSVAIQIAAGISTPGLASREAGTKVEVKDGETVVLAGIKQSRRTKIITKVPILGSIPLLGLLFRHKEEQMTQTSLVFFVTFRLVK